MRRLRLTDRGAHVAWFAALFALGCAIAANSMAGQRNTEERRSDDAIVTSIPGAHPVNAPQGIPSVASFSIKDLTVEPAGRAIHVAAQAMMKDARPGDRKFVWTLSVYEPNNRSKCFFTKVYGDQQFRIPADRISRPTFEEVIPFQPGTYQAVLSICEVPQDQGLEVLKDLATALPYRAAKNTQVVTIP